MKKLIAVSLLCLQLFSICGHMALYTYLVYRCDKLFNEQISKGRYNVNDLVEIKVPYHSSIFQNWAGYEKVSGQIQFKNTSYNYVKLRLTKDTIFLMCVPNYEETRLISENIINAKNIPDIPVNKKEHIPFGKVYSPGSFNYTLLRYSFLPLASALQTIEPGTAPDLTTGCLTIPHQPPKVVFRYFS